MKTNQLRSLAIVAVLWLILGAGCHKDSAELCKNGECCWPNETNQFIRRLEGSRAGRYGSGFWFQEILGPGYLILPEMP